MKEKISSTSELLLIRLWKNLMTNERQNSLLVSYDLDKFEPQISIDEANICMQYLQDLGYIQNPNIDEKTHIVSARLHGRGIQFVESKVKDLAEALI